MSKSLGNLVFVHDLLKDWEPAAIRLAVIAHHYRHDWDWHAGLMPDASGAPAGMAGGGPGDGALAEVRQALDDDLDTAVSGGRHRRSRPPRVGACPRRPPSRRGLSRAPPACDR